MAHDALMVLVLLPIWLAVEFVFELLSAMSDEFWHRRRVKKAKAAALRASSAGAAKPSGAERLGRAVGRVCRAAASGFRWLIGERC